MVDFNGVFDQYEGWTGEVRSFPPASGIDQFLIQLRENFKTIIVCSATMPIESVQAWIAEHELNHLVDYVTNHKPPAVVYVDDKAVRHEGDFDQTLSLILNGGMKAHWQKGDLKSNP